MKEGEPQQVLPERLCWMLEDGQEPIDHRSGRPFGQGCEGRGSEGTGTSVGCRAAGRWGRPAVGDRLGEVGLGCHGCLHSFLSVPHHRLPQALLHAYF